MDAKEQAKILEEFEPYARTLIAITMFITFGYGNWTVEKTYGVADKFIEQLKKDLAEAARKASTSTYLTRENS